MSASELPYLHGFSEKEQNRLRQQAAFLENLLMSTIDFSEQQEVLEIGCGVGAQSEILLRRFPQLKLTGIDQNEKQLESAKKFLDQIPWARNRYNLALMNATDLTFKASSFDAAYICFVLEHVANPEQILSEVRRVLRPGSWLHIHEVMNHTFFLDPYSPNVWKYWMAFNDYQFEQTGDPFVGAKLGNLLSSTGFQGVQTQVKTMHYDHRQPEKRTKTIEFWGELMLSAADLLIQENVITPELVEEVKKELQSVLKNPKGVFFYSLMYAKAQVY